MKRKEESDVNCALVRNEYETGKRYGRNSAGNSGYEDSDGHWYGYAFADNNEHKDSD